MGCVYKLVVLNYALFTLVCVNIFVHYCWDSEGLEGARRSCIVWSGGWVSQRSTVMAVCSFCSVGVLLWRTVPLRWWYVRRASGFCGVIGISLIEKNLR